MIERTFFDPLYEIRNKPIDETSEFQNEQLIYDRRQMKNKFAAAVTAEIRNMYNAGELEQQHFLESLLDKLKSEEYSDKIVYSIENTTPEGIAVIRNDAIRQAMYVAELIIATFIDQIEYILAEKFDLNSDDYEKATIGSFPATEYARHVINSNLKDKLSILTPDKFKASVNIKRAQEIVFNSFKD